MTPEEKARIAYKYVTKINAEAKDDALLLATLADMTDEVEKFISIKTHVTGVCEVCGKPVKNDKTLKLALE